MGAAASEGSGSVAGMRLLHTSDWHLGRSLHGVDLLDAQAAHLDHLVEVARTEAIDAVIVAGDIFDRAVPPAEAVTVFSEAMARLAERTRVVLIPGNHDSARRLSYGTALWRDRAVLAGDVTKVGTPIEVPGTPPLLIYPIPYLEPDQARVALASGPALARSHEAVLAAAMARVRADRARRTGPFVTVVAAHAFVVGGAPSESERDIRVGGVDSVPAGVFAGADYVALGHLHGPQGIGGPDQATIRYAGSPLAYSFSEARHVKSTALVSISKVDADGARSVDVVLVPAPVPYRLSELRGTLAEVLGPASDPQREDWLRIVVTDPVRPEHLITRVKDKFPHALQVTHEAPTLERPAAAHIVAGMEPMAVASQFFQFATGAEPSPAERAVLLKALEDVRQSAANDGERARAGA